MKLKKSPSFPHGIKRPFAIPGKGLKAYRAVLRMAMQFSRPVEIISRMNLGADGEELEPKTLRDTFPKPTPKEL